MASGIIHVLADLSSQGETPGEWSARVVSAFRRFEANRVVAEINNGGEMVAQVLRQNDPNLPVRTVTATRGKFLRAEPIAAAYERGSVFHLGAFEKLEDQLCTLTLGLRLARRRLLARSRRRAGLGDRRSHRAARASPGDMLDYLRTRHEGRTYGSRGEIRPRAASARACDETRRR